MNESESWVAGQAQGTTRQLREVLAKHVRREAELEELNHAARDLTRIREVEHTLRKVTERTKRLLDCDVAYLSAGVEGEGDFAVRAWSGNLSPAFLGIRVSVGNGVGGAVAATRQPVQVEDYLRAPEIEHNDYLDSHVRGEGIRTLLGVPLEVDGRLLGVLFAGRRTPLLFQESEIVLVSSLAAHAAVALDNAQLFESQETTMRELQRYASLLKTQNEAAEASAEVHEQLTQVLLRGEGVGHIMAIIGRALKVDVAMIDEAGAVLAGHGENPPSPPFTEEVEAALKRSRKTGRSVSAGGPDGRRWYVDTAAAGPTFLGSVLLASTRELTDVEVRTFERATQTTSVSRLADAAMAEAEMRASSEVIRRLIDPRRSSLDDLDRLARRHQLSAGPVTVTASDAEHGRNAAHLAAAVALCSETGGLAAWYEDRLVTIQPGDPKAVAESLWRRLRSSAGSPATVSAAGPARSLLELSHLYRESVQCLKLMHQLGRSSTWGSTAEFGIYSMLFTEGASDGLDHFVDSNIGRLLEYDTRHGADLVTTATAYLESSSSPSATASMLDIHVNTVSQRISRIDRMLGPDWRQSPRQLELHTALRLHALRAGGHFNQRSDQIADR
ncbi:GAF domain-containing protein [Arthrobacter sp. KBS0703]|uniref:helix-turn-helix domain-containing protein n=1 Tax=Arthrobacter sp. KBS0703 TaxID=1955698 RepID=UPI0009C47594|nr:GAF domain-containing protein [Arthrobacter sp. KBS0703]